MGRQTVVTVGGDTVLILSCLLYRIDVYDRPIHYLYDIDILINRTLVYSALTVVFAGIFVIIDEVAQELFLAVTQQEKSWLSVIVSALVIAALSEPLKHRIEHVVDRRIFRKEADS